MPYIILNPHQILLGW